MPETWFHRARQLTLDLVRHASVTGSEGEGAFGPYLRDLLAALPYFATHPEDLWLEPTVGDRHQRANLFALVRGEGRETVVLAGHYDTVSLEPYGPLSPLACEPEALLPRLVDALRRAGTSAADTRALADLESGDFLPGRGVLDMKSGLAAGIAVLERFAATPGRRGNLLFLATPDEEVTSLGMRSAALALPGLARERGLELAAAINLDATNDPGDGTEGQAVYLGSVGKLLPSVLFVGRPTHAGFPFDGLNANLLVAELVRRAECEPDHADAAHGEVAPPPVNLKLADLKDYYDVTTPELAWCTFNQLTHGAAPSRELERWLGLARAAIEEASALMRERAARWAARRGPSGQGARPGLAWEPAVLSFAELAERAFARRGAAAEREWAALAEGLAGGPGIDLPTFSRRATAELVRWADLEGPAAVVCWGALYYPPVHLDAGAPRHRRLEEAARRQAEAVGREYGRPISLRPFFAGISDMSFLAAKVPAEDVEAIAANSPAWGTDLLRFDYAASVASARGGFGLPSINAGPWGRDYHQRLERVYAPYSFGVLPELVWRIARDLLSAGG